MERIFHFKKTDYRQSGFHNTRSDITFLDFIFECEQEFHRELKPLYANVMSASSATFQLLKTCFVENDGLHCGMESMDGEVDIDMNIKIEEFSENSTIYALGSMMEENIDEPIFLVVDDGLPDTCFSLKYSPDDDEEDEVPMEPVEKVYVLM